LVADGPVVFGGAVLDFAAAFAGRDREFTWFRKSIIIGKSRSGKRIADWVCFPRPDSAQWCVID